MTFKMSATSAILCDFKVVQLCRDFKSYCYTTLQEHWVCYLSTGMTCLLFLRNLLSMTYAIICSFRVIQLFIYFKRYCFTTLQEHRVCYLSTGMTCLLFWRNLLSMISAIICDFRVLQKLSLHNCWYVSFPQA